MREVNPHRRHLCARFRRSLRTLRPALAYLALPLGFHAVTQAAHAAVVPGKAPPAALRHASRNGVLSAQPAVFSQLSTQSKFLHVVVGHSVVLNTSTMMRRVYVSDPAVLSIFTASPRQVLVTAKKPGVSSFAVWDSSGQSTVYTVSADVDAEGLRGAMSAAFPQDPIEVTALQDRITLTGLVPTQDASDGAAKLAAFYAKDVVNSLRLLPVHAKQVQLQVRIAEVDRTRAQQFGFNFLTGGNNTAIVGTQQFASFGSTVVGGAAAATAAAATGVGISNPLNLLLYNANLNVGAAIADLEQKQILQILAEPTITALSGVSASFLSGGEFPFPVVQGGSGGFTSVTIQFRPYGVKLDFTPYVNADGTIRLKVVPEVSALDYTNEVKISGYDIPAIDTRRAQTEVELRDGQSFAISGLLDHRLTDAFSRMPGIASIPILGQLFRSKDKSASTVELVVIVTPHIVDPLTTDTAPQLPTLVKPYLDPHGFDQLVNKKRNQKPQP